MAQTRLNRELAKMCTIPPAFCSAGPVGGNLFKWQASIIGPKDSPYSGGVFKLEIFFHPDYPNEPPVVMFLTKVFHLNIVEHEGYGVICLDILRQKWKPEISVGDLLLSICNLLANPNPNDPLDRAKAELYVNDLAEYDKKAREFTRKYAKP